MSNIDDLCEKLDRLSTAIEQYALSNLDLVKLANQKIETQLATYEPPLPYPTGEDAGFHQDLPQRSEPGPLPFQQIVPPFPASQPGNCPKGHGPFVLKPAGITKRGPRAGQPYEAFWACNGKNADGSFCNERPKGQAA